MDSYLPSLGFAEGGAGEETPPPSPRSFFSLFIAHRACVVLCFADIFKILSMSVDES